MPDASTMSPPSSLTDIDMTFLPVGQMRQIARVTSLEGPTIAGEIDLGQDHWVWSQHFPGDPIFPGTLMIEGAGQLLALWAWLQGQRGRPRLVRTSAEFHNPVEPGSAHLLLKGEVQRKRHLYFGSIQVSSGDIRVATVEAVLVILPAS
jgi:3-hydroxymyristoyl/3-hydroxydecanoyl-(acyl carrier protein) dehydratase